MRAPLRGHTHPPQARGGQRKAGNRYGAAMGLFSRKQVEPAPEGNGQAPLTATFPRGEDALVEVVGIEHRWEVARAMAGKRPRGEDDYTEREKAIKVRLVREPANEHDPNAPAVWSDKHGQVGYVPRKVAAQLSPLIDDMRKAAGKGAPGKAVDIYCAADLFAEWDEWDPDPANREDGADKDNPDTVEITLALRLPLEARVTARDPD